MDKIIFIASILTISTAATAEVPEAKVEYTNVYQSHATMAGKLTSRPVEPVGVTVENGGLKYSTITDGDGAWGLVFKYRSSNYTVTTFELKDATSKSPELKGRLP
jgi:hypothetical protein